ncbi:DNA polymerase [Clostridium acetobutylicum]|uniref:Type-4 uracil-DNA glycosylase n=1 Tax=Clostridium acetobutylicum (strain ATCC 824 / DSM 792 / JCM 1419 / IAM 19013 / LMG 5710 / NBRC 13948 / NRRL B-527 / VKM B-1787 / 2291 / W) TaxID=272562 RepID=Q97EV9_CLOAB|nr:MULTISPECIES: uracil-DNA glycosylase [Clostridium]AAK80938.1 Uracil-DNA glycosylase [Clostridium acetobutylicum ATCC 824]ADZ22040.1 Uracil-DNA glycosylase [Clostridium acetobutylicum EA 2018]AEI32638.1 Uracil-DNA glycosylase [Clostridium acetobutylicum DSM 1731]AWV78651.1 uracil-DNA glycosylase [Clostridium acetobutylicum]MBC2393512.1 uracil-DNA glycosylase [Clostridium acetobutylicum]
MLQWRELYNECIECQKCRLGENRTNMVFGEGNPEAKLMFVGEAPGADEDRLGRPFVGRAGQLLTKGLTALNLSRDRDYYIANVCKCRPEKNRTPYEDEAEACMPYLRNQFALIKPKILVCLGSTAMKFIMEPALNKILQQNNTIEEENLIWKNGQMRITRDRGKWLKVKGIYMMATFHPAALFRDENKKTAFWEDLKLIKAKYVDL